MKAIYFLKSLALIALVVVATNAKAVDITVADGATDTELAAALDQAQTGDVILINGWVTINAVVDITKNVTIKAGVENAGFAGSGSTRLFELHPEPIAGAKLVFDNLGFVDGNATSGDVTDGGVARINGGGVTEFVLCYFDNNIAYRGGAFFITGDANADPTTASFKGCDATNNIAQGNGGESRGGYFFTDGNTHITHEYCKIESNQSIGGRGGALCLFGNGTRHFYYTTISSNKAGNWSDDETQKLDKDGNPTGDGEYEGGVAFITGGATTFESCGIIDNKSWSHSGIIRGWGDDQTTVTFVNTTLALNQSLHDRAPLWIGGDATYTFVNSFFVNNKGQNQGNGAGFDFDSNRVKLNIFNSVFARNIAGGDGAVDIRNGAPYASLTVKNSLIGLIQGASTSAVVSDNATIPTKSDIAMYKLADETAALSDAIEALDHSGVDYGLGVKYSKSFKMPYYLLKAGSDVTKLGDPALLSDYDLTADLFDQSRTIAADGSISAAPTLVSVDDEYDDSGWEEKISTAIKQISTPQVAQNIRVIGYATNGILGVDFGHLKGLAKGQLLSINGQVVENVFNTNVVGKGYYNIKTTTPGFYILKVSIDGKTYATRLIVK
jgi:hypothetical protein